MTGDGAPRSDDGHASGTLVLPAHPSSVGAARRAVRAVLTQGRRDDLAETAQLLVSELVTNALVHAGTAIDLHAFVGGEGLRVEVSDGSLQEPVPRRYATTAGTGRGLQLIQQLVDRWGTVTHPDGKTVWFELDSGDRLDEIVSVADTLLAGPAAPADTTGTDVIDVVLLNVPLLLHVAWREHADTVLREYLLVSLDSDDPVEALEAHAAASDALALLHRHLPKPHLGDDADELMANAVEPGVSSVREVLPVPRTSAANFQVLDQSLDAALVLAEAGVFLTVPIQPELRELRRWLCREVSRQVDGEPPTRWSSNSDSAPAPRSPATSALEVPHDEGEALVVADDANRIVFVTPGALDLLGYEEPADLLGRRLVAIIPTRYHQAHLAGFALHLSNGRSPLLGRTVVVPVRRSDGTEIPVELWVEARQHSGGRHLFVARMRPGSPS